MQCLKGKKAVNFNVLIVWNKLVQLLKVESRFVFYKFEMVSIEIIWIPVLFDFHKIRSLTTNELLKSFTLYATNRLTIHHSSQWIKLDRKLISRSEKFFLHKKIFVCSFWYFIFMTTYFPWGCLHLAEFIYRENRDEMYKYDVIRHQFPIYLMNFHKVFTYIKNTNKKKRIMKKR